MPFFRRDENHGPYMTLKVNDNQYGGLSYQKLGILFIFTDHY